MFSERSQSEQAPRCVIPTLWHPGKGETTETVKGSAAAVGLEEEARPEHRGPLGQGSHSLYSNKPKECATLGEARPSTTGVCY